MINSLITNLGNTIYQFNIYPSTLGNKDVNGFMFRIQMKSDIYFGNFPSYYNEAAINNIGYYSLNIFSGYVNPNNKSKFKSKFFHEILHSPNNPHVLGNDPIEFINFSKLYLRSLKDNSFNVKITVYSENELKKYLKGMGHEIR